MGCQIYCSRSHPICPLVRIEGAYGACDSDANFGDRRISYSPRNCPHRKQSSLGTIIDWWWRQASKRPGTLSGHHICCQFCSSNSSKHSTRFFAWPRSIAMDLHNCNRSWNYNGAYQLCHIIQDAGTRGIFQQRRAISMGCHKRSSCPAGISCIHIYLHAVILPFWHGACISASLCKRSLRAGRRCNNGIFNCCKPRLNNDGTYNSPRCGSPWVEATFHNL